MTRHITIDDSAMLRAAIDGIEPPRENICWGTDMLVAQIRALEAAGYTVAHGNLGGRLAVTDDPADQADADAIREGAWDAAL